MASYTATVKGTQKLYGFYGNGNGATYTITVTNGTGVMKKYDVIRRPIRGGIPNVVQTGYSGTAVTYTENARFDFELEIWADVTTAGTFTATVTDTTNGDNVAMMTWALDSSGNPLGAVSPKDGSVIPFTAQTVTRLVATRGEVNLLQSQANTTNKLRLTGRSQHKIGGRSVSSIGASWTNWFLDTSRVENSIANAVTLRAHIEIPGAPTPVVVVKFSGASSGSMPSGSVDFPCDLLDASAFGLTVIPAEQVFFVVTEMTVALNEYAPASVAPQEAGEAATYGDGTATQIGTAGALTNQSGGAVTTAMPMPSAIIGKFSSPYPSVILFGDSIVFGAKDGGPTAVGGGGGVLGGGIFARACWNSAIPYARQARTGTQAIQAAVNYTKQSGLWKYASHFICNLGTNDLNAGQTAATTQTNLRILWAAAKAAGVQRVEQALIMSRTTSTDAWVTVANQTPITGFETGGTKKDALNTLLVANVGANGLDAVLDLSPQWRDTVAADKINASYVDDGTHPLPIAAQRVSLDASTRFNNWQSKD